MKTIEIAFTTADYNEVDNLINVASIEDVNKIKKVAELLRPVSKDLHSFNIDVILFDIPEGSDFRYDVGYVRCYIGFDGRLSLYQYFQSKWDSGLQIESEEINLTELETYLNKQKL